jgi:hypothetical protein
VALQRSYDARRRVTWNQFDARVAAIYDARRSLTREPYAAFALRQALIDLSAACAEAAARLAPPNRP